MEQHAPVEVDKKAIQDAQTMWENFTAFGKYTILATIVVLIGLALAFVKFF